MAYDFTTDQEINETMDDEGRVRLSTVLSPNDKDDWLLNCWIGILVLVSDFEHWDVKVAI